MCTFKKYDFRVVLIFFLFSLIFLLFGYTYQSVAQTITAAEYFIDEEPGPGSGTALNAADGAFNSQEEAAELSGINISSLKSGYHTVYVRFKNSDGLWGLTRPLTFDQALRSPYNVFIKGQKWIEEAEYYIDEDPGEGNGTRVTPVDGAFDEKEEDFEVSTIDVSPLSPGSHTLYLRIKDNEGTWGIARKVVFEVYENNTIIVAAEYLIDDEPGPGNGIPLTPKDGSFDSPQEEVDVSGIEVTGLEVGLHVIYIRFKDSLNRWGALKKQLFAVGRPIAYSATPPVQPDTGDGQIPITVVAEDSSGSDTCKLKIEYTLNETGNWHNITIEEGSISASYGNPALDNNAHYQIGNHNGWIQTSSGPNTLNLIWLSVDDLPEVETQKVRLRFTIHNGVEEHVTSTESISFSVDNKPPDVPLIVAYSPDTTGDRTPTLIWKSVSDAVHYHLQIASDAQFNNIIVERTDITTRSYTPASPLPFGDIYWRVSALDGLNNESDFSNVDSFTVFQDTEPPSVVLSYSESSPVRAGPLTITGLFSELLATVPRISINQPGNDDLEPTQMSKIGDKWFYTYYVSCADGEAFVDGTAQVTISNGFDYAGNENTQAQNNIFDIDTSACGSGTISAAEYFIDNDPGPGNGAALDAGDGDFASSEESVELSDIDITHLKIGYHTLYVRFKSSEGIWGMARPLPNDRMLRSPYNFHKKGQKWITAAEYFIDNDPGAGNGIPVTPVDGTFDDPEEDFELSNIDVSHLVSGFHTLYFRVKNNESTWGIVRQMPFEVYHNNVNLAGAEYFIDEDPGQGSGILLSAKDGQFDSPEEEVHEANIAVNTLSRGVHTIYVRFMDIRGRWSALESQQFTVNRNQPSDPFPPDLATNVPVTTSFSWKAEYTHNSHDIYLWKDGSEKPKHPTDYNLTEPAFTPDSPLDSNTTYRWQVVAQGDYGEMWGPEWSFTTQLIVNNPPFVPSSPSPSPGTVDVPVNITLSWQGGDPDINDTVTYDVYADKNNPPTVKESQAQSGTSYTLTGLDYTTTYYWKIVARDNHGAETEGPIWHFITKEDDTPVSFSLINIVRNDMEDITVTFESVPDKSYHISSKYLFTDSFTIVDTVTASALTTNWTDDGSATGTHPTEVQERYYKVTHNSLDSENVVGMFRITAYEGMNLISLPLIPFSTELEDVIGSQVTGADNEGDADRLWVWNGSNYEFAWLVDGVSEPYDGKWYTGNEQTTLTFDADQGAWLQIREGHEPVDVYILGEVSSSNREIPVNVGMNLIGSSYPVPVPLMDTNLWQSGMTGADNEGSADRVWAWIGNHYEFYWLVDGVDEDFNGLWYMSNEAVERELKPGSGYWLQIRQGHDAFNWDNVKPY